MSSGYGQPNLRKALNRHLEELPVLPTVVSRLMALDPRSEGYFEEVRELIESEPNFATRILAAANSAASAPSSPITTIPAAIARIGSIGARNLVFALGVTRVFVPRDDWEKSLWRHALQTASAARALASRLGDPEVQADEAYICGLLHDVGRFVMFQEAPDALRRIDEGGWDTADELVDLEKQICGLTHADLGAMACERWRLPDTIVEVVRNHHRKEFTASRKVTRLTGLIHLADIAMFPSALPGASDLAELGEEEVWSSLHNLLPPFLHLGTHELYALVAEATRQAEMVAEGIGIA